jgi:hypothetical protein
VLCTFNITTFLKQQVEGFKRHHKKLKLQILSFVKKKVLRFQHQHLQLQSSSRRKGDYFEIIDFEGPARIFRNRHPRPLELAFSRFIQRIDIILTKLHLKRARGSGGGEIRLKKKCAQWPSNQGLSLNLYSDEFSVRYF